MIVPVSKSCTMYPCKLKKYMALHHRCINHVRRVFNVHWNRIRSYTLRVEVNSFVYVCASVNTFINLTCGYIRCCFTEPAINNQSLQNLKSSWKLYRKPIIRLFELRTFKLSQRNEVSNISRYKSIFFNLNERQKSLSRVPIFNQGFILCLCIFGAKSAISSWYDKTRTPCARTRSRCTLLLPRMYVCVSRGSILISRRAKIIHCQ